MNIDVKTGLPELPEGYYWEIREGIYRPYDIIYNYTLRPLEISICMRYKRWLGTKVIRVTSALMMGGKDMRDHYVEDPTTENILRYAEKVLTKFEWVCDKQSAIGEYPPKKLEGSK